MISRDLADRQEKQQLEEEEDRAEIESWLTLSDNDDGTTSGRFVIPELHGHLLRALLEQLSAPRRLSRNRAGDLVSDPTVPGGGPGLNWSERLGAASTELMEHLPTAGWGRSGMSVTVHVDYAHMLDGLAGAGLDTGTRISAGQARRLACDNGIIPAVLGAEGEVLDLGRERRLHSPGQRRALSVRHDGCAAEGCERPFAWCEIHHPHPWGEGGATSLSNAIPLCGHHHRRAHDDRFTFVVLPSGEGRFRRARRSA